MKHHNVRGFWKPNQAVIDAESRYKFIQKKRKLQRKFGKLSNKQRLCHLPSEEFYETKAWKLVRKIILQKYGRVCMKCGSTKQIQVDHIKPRSKWPSLSLNLGNLQVLCKACNKIKSNKNCNDYRETNVPTSELPRKSD